MNLEIFCLCRRAETVEGTLNIAGVWDAFQVAGVPVVMQPFYAAARLRLESHETGDYEFTFRLLDADGALIGPAVSGHQRSMQLSGMPFGSISYVQRFEGWRWERPGLYACHLDVNGSELGMYPFWIAVQRPSGQAPSGPQRRSNH